MKKYIKFLKYRTPRHLICLNIDLSHIHKFTNANLNEKATEELQLSLKIYEHIHIHT